MKNLNAELLSTLNPEQTDAVTSLGKPLLVLSGAGTGKTKVLTTKIAYLIENGYAFPYQILAVTFSNRAAREMKDRLASLIGATDGIWLGTFHSICARLLRMHAEAIGLGCDFTIIDSDDQQKVVHQILKEKNIDKKMTNYVINCISRWKDKCIGYNDERLDHSTTEASVYEIYQKRLRSYNSVDFGDLIMYMVEIFKKNPEILQKYQERFKYILVDEYQDTNMSQYYWLKLLSPQGAGLCCVGDDDQAIYSWRGAEVGNILRFEKDFNDTKIIRLERNYRSVGNILGAASSLIANNEKRLGKMLWTEGEKGEKIQVRCAYNGFDEARIIAESIESLNREGISYGGMAVLVRAGFQTREIEERLIAYGLPYKVIGGMKFYDRQEIKDIIAYMRLIYQTNDGLAFERIINVPKRGIGAAALSVFHDYANKNNVSLYQACKDVLSSGILRPSVRNALNAFIVMIEELREQKNLKPSELANEILDRTGYLIELNKEKTLEAMARIENLRELVRALEEFEDLQSFIEHVSLVTDTQKAANEDLVSVMTLHSAKGLEFDAVFLAGWEEGLFPHNLSLQEGNVEEERRLAYVGITRAKKYACITYAQNRRVYNQWVNNVPSRFLAELSEEYVEFCS